MFTALRPIRGSSLFTELGGKLGFSCSISLCLTSESFKFNEERCLKVPYFFINFCLTNQDLQFPDDIFSGYLQCMSNEIKIESRFPYKIYFSVPTQTSLYRFVQIRYH